MRVITLVDLLVDRLPPVHYNHPMPKYIIALVALVVIAGAIFLMLPSDAEAVSLPPNLCEGKRFDGETYEDFFARPTLRVSDHYRCLWKQMTWNVIEHHCGASSAQRAYEKPDCSGRR